MVRGGGRRESDPRRAVKRCWIELDFAALRHNARVARERGGCELIAIVKANGYGLGAARIAKALRGQARMFGVACLSEAAALRDAGLREPVLLLGSCLPEDRKAALELGATPCVSSLEEAIAWDALARRSRRGPLAVHVALDTGMGRIGIPEEIWAPPLVSNLASLGNLRYEALASHFPSADTDREFTRGQIERFARHRALAAAHGLFFEHAHLGNSAGILGYPRLRSVSDHARPGLMLYGVSPFARMQPLLRPVLAWSTRVTLIRELPRGHGVSYGRTFLTRRKITRVATLAAGYGDGYPRALSGQGAEVLVRGVRCPLLGRVTMDQIMVDVTGVPANVGDAAVLIGRQGAEEITTAEIARKAGTIPWEILTRLTARVERAAP